MKIINIFFLFLFINLNDQIFNEFISKVSNINKNLRKLQENKSFITKIYYSNKDNYYIKLFIGEEYTPQTLIIDTTFSLISSPCNLCEKDNPNLFPFYIINNETDIIKCSSQQCYNKNNCEKEKCYFNINNKLNSNKNIEGYLINSKILLNTTKGNNYNSGSLLFTIPIGCTIKEGKYYNNKNVKGIIGLSNDNNTLIDNMFQLKIISKNIFSICLSKNGGYLSFGQTKNYSYNNNIDYINFLSPQLNNNLYKLKINYIEIEQEKSNSESKAYIDSTNTYSYFPKNIYNFIFQVLKKENKIDKFNYDEQNGFCRIIEKEKKKNILNNSFPSITISFESYKFEWKSNNYIIESNVKENNYIKICLGFKELIDSDEDLILGTNFMTGNDIIFDKNNQKIGFVKTDCDQYISFDESIENMKYKNDSNILPEFLEQQENIKNNSPINEIKLKTILKSDYNIFDEIESKIYFNNNNSNNSNEIKEEDKIIIETNIFGNNSNSSIMHAMLNYNNLESTIINMRNNNIINDKIVFNINNNINDTLTYNSNVL